MLEKLLGEPQYTTICNSLAHFCEQGIMRDRVKVALQVRIHHPEVARFQMPVHLTQRILATQTLPKAKASGLEFVFKDWLDHQLQRSLHHAIFDSRYAERAPRLAFGYVYTSNGLRRVNLGTRP